MRVVTVIGNRPQFVKAAAVSGPLRERHREILINTGQHYDDALSAVFFRELGLPAADYELGLGQGSNGEQTGRMLQALSPLVTAEQPDVMLVYGDTNSTLAGGLAGAQAGVPVTHVEAGMRSYDRSMPEELNRVLCDHLSTLLLCPSPAAVENLRAEGLDERAEVVGDVMVDVARLVASRTHSGTAALDAAGVSAGGYLLATAHRAANVDDPARLRRLCELLLALPEPVILPLHPRTRARLEQTGELARLAAGVRLLEPQGYLPFAALLSNASAVLTDSGGVQKEAYLAGVRCLTLRDRTEWTETVDSGWNSLVDLDVQAALRALERPPPPPGPALYGDGHAGRRVVRALEGMAAGERL